MLCIPNLIYMYLKPWNFEREDFETMSAAINWLLGFRLEPHILFHHLPLQMRVDYLTQGLREESKESMN